MAIVKTRERVYEDSATISKEVDKVIIGTIAAMGSLIGMWSVACLVSATYQAGGIMPLFMGWISAVSGTG